MGLQFRGSIPRLHLPLSTLHLRRYRLKYMTRSQCGSLLLHCMKLSFTTPCRLLPAHLNVEQAKRLNLEQARYYFPVHSGRNTPATSSAPRPTESSDFRLPMNTSLFFPTSPRPLPLAWSPPRPHMPSSPCP